MGPREHLTDKKAIAAYINAALEDGDPAVIAAAARDVARAQVREHPKAVAKPPAKPAKKGK